MARLLFRDLLAGGSAGLLKDRPGFAGAGGVHLARLALVDGRAMLDASAMGSTGAGLVAIPGFTFTVGASGERVQEVEFYGRMVNTSWAAGPFVSFFTNTATSKGIVFALVTNGPYRAGTLKANYQPFLFTSDSVNGFAGKNGSLRGASRKDWPVTIRARCTLNTDNTARVQAWETSPEYGEKLVFDLAVTGATANSTPLGPPCIGIDRASLATSDLSGFFTAVVVRDGLLPVVADALAVVAPGADPLPAYARQHAVLPAVEVRAVDASGALDPAAAGTVAVAVDEDGVQLRGTLARPLVNGRAVFDDLRLGGAPGPTALRFSCTGYADAGHTVTLQREPRFVPALTAVDDGEATPVEQPAWMSSDETVVTIDASGAPVAVGDGTATLTATHGGRSVSITVNVGGDHRRRYTS